MTSGTDFLKCQAVKKYIYFSFIGGIDTYHVINLKFCCTIFKIVPVMFSQNFIIKSCTIKNKVTWGEREKTRLLTVTRDLSKANKK